MNKGTAIVGFFLCFLAGMGLMYGVDRKTGVEIGAEPTAGGGSDQSDSPIPVTSKDPQWGKATAPVTVVTRLLTPLMIVLVSTRVRATNNSPEEVNPMFARISWETLRSPNRCVAFLNQILYF